MQFACISKLESLALQKQSIIMESIETLISKYRKLNDSFTKTMVYHIGIDAGFFAEYTYMLNAMLYWLENHIRFTLYSKDANFAFQEGWRDFFQLFCEEKNESFHHLFNRQFLL